MYTASGLYVDTSSFETDVEGHARPYGPGSPAAVDLRFGTGRVASK